MVAPELTPELQQLLTTYSVNYQAREFADDDIQGQFLIIAATNNAKVNAHVAALANQVNIPVNVVDDQA